MAFYLSFFTFTFFIEKQLSTNLDDRKRNAMNKSTLVLSYLGYTNVFIELIVRGGNRDNSFNHAELS